MFKGIANLTSLIRNAQQIGVRVQEIQEKLKGRRATGASGGGMVEVELNGVLEVLHCKIDPQLLAQGDRELLEDLIVAAANQAISKGRQLHAEMMRELTGGIELPGLQDAIDKFSGNVPEDEPPSAPPG